MVDFRVISWPSPSTALVCTAGFVTNRAEAKAATSRSAKAARDLQKPYWALCFVAALVLIAVVTIIV